MENKYNHLYLNQTLTKGERTRLRIMEDSLKCFALNGFEGSSLSEIAKHIGVKAPLLFHYFKSKESFQHELFEYILSVGRAFVEDYISNSKNFDNDEIEILKYIRSQFAWVEQFPHHTSYFVSYLHRATYDKPTRNVMHTMIETSLKSIENRLEHTFKKHAGKKPKNIGPLAREIYCALLGGFLMAKVMGKASVKSQEEHVIRIVRNLTGT
jgi:TetR/AcrR family transcriptional repressor of cmeABC operon